MGFLCGVHGDIVAFGFDPIDFRCLKKIDASGRFDHQAFEILVAGLQLFQQGQNALVGATIAFAYDLLEELKRSEEHTSEVQSRSDLVCRLLLEKKKKR